MSGCINLKRQFGDRYKVTYEESYSAERGERGRAEDPWLMMLLCQHGHISPWGDDSLVACTSHSGRIPKRLMAEVPSAETWMDGDDGTNIRFHVRDFETAVAIMKPRRRRRLSAEHRQKLIEATKPYRFSGRSRVSESDSDERRRVQRGKDGQRVMATTNERS